MAESKTTTTGNGGKAKAAATPPAPFAGYPSLPALHDEMSRMMQRFFNDDWMPRMMRMGWPTEWPRMMTAEMPFASLATMPRADMTEADGEYELSVELPGLDEKDIEVTLTEDAIVLKGEKKQEKETKEKDYHFTERSYGSIRRTFALPRGVDPDAMKATFSKGVLKIVLPKTPEAKSKPRRIEVKGG